MKKEEAVIAREKVKDEWAGFAEFLAKLIQCHAEELNMESWMDPESVLRIRELYESYVKQAKENRQEEKYVDILEITPQLCYSLYIQATQKEVQPNDNQ